jgi:hypothetical protein
LISTHGVSTPEGGATMMLLGMGSVGLIGMRRLINA